MSPVLKQFYNHGDQIRHTIKNYGKNFILKMLNNQMLKLYSKQLLRIIQR